MIPIRCVPFFAMRCLLIVPGRLDAQPDLTSDVAFFNKQYRCVPHVLYASVFS
jgi:hypothetical protein